MSLLIITSHVKDGLEMARQYRLPAILHEFIATHHGTTLVQYFYQVAAGRKGESDRAPQEVEFRYPGPKPRTKEAAILMLADASESSVRSMAEPTPGRIENQVHAMVMRRLMDGQLDDCDLMLREVRQIEESLVKTLNAIYHTRVGYPTPAGQKPSAAELHKRETPPAATPPKEPASPAPPAPAA
jgi:membrane-associated HD superfamily phosphohydrolase